MKLCDPNECTGCAACVNTCPTGCLTMQKDRNGFLYPDVNTEICVDCGKCSAICPILNPVLKHEKPEGAVCTYCDEEKLKKSSSGGMAYALSKRIINDGGTVFGAVYDDMMRVVHMAVSEESGLDRLQGSKYVQSETGKCYEKAKALLRDKKEVLYFGTPCQIAGLLSFIPNELQDNLYTCDILCAGVPSPAVFERYTEYLEKKYHGKLIDLNFRSKKYGYSYGYLHELEMFGGKRYTLKSSDSTYVKSVGIGYVRNACFSCTYRTISRISDITIGDFSGFGKESESGLSSVLINTEKGRELFESVMNCIECDSIDVGKISNDRKGVFKTEKSKPLDYDSFFEDAKKLDWQSFSEMYLSCASKKEKLLENLPPWIIAKIRKVVNLIKR